MVLASNFEKYLRIYSCFYNRSYILDFINKKNNKIKEALVASDENTNILECIQNYTYAEFFDVIYKAFKNSYKCEYYYLNEIFINEILKNHDAEHSVLTELCVNKSQADLVVINGTTTIYEIKTELDNLSRLSGQLNDYVQVFDKVYVVTYRELIDKLTILLDSDRKYSQVGIYILNDECKLELQKSSGSHLEFLNKQLMFEALTRREFECLDKNYEKAKSIFANYSIEDAHEYFRNSLFHRGKDIDYISALPDSLKLVGYKLQNKLTIKQKNKLYNKLNTIIGEDF